MISRLTEEEQESLNRRIDHIANIEAIQRRVNRVATIVVGAFVAACVIITTLAVYLLMTAPTARAEPFPSSTSRSFYDRNGSFAGSSTTRGNSTTFTDRDGKFGGTSIRNSDGTTSVYDRSGHFVGSSTNTTQPR